MKNILLLNRFKNREIKKTLKNTGQDRLCHPLDHGEAGAEGTAMGAVPEPEAAEGCDGDTRLPAARGFKQTLQKVNLEYR